MKIDIFTFKWGTKYGPEYVNRLYGSLLKHINVPFNFTCITDDTLGINSDISTLEHSKFDHAFNSYPRDRLFTREKLELFNYSSSEHNVFLDLDILIHKDITDLVTMYHEKPTFIFRAGGSSGDIGRGYGQMCSSLVNSSMVGWSRNSGKYIYDYTLQNLEKIMFTYSSLDKYLFYQHQRKGNLNFWDDGIFYNYNYNNSDHVKDESRRVVLFNTSHISDSDTVRELHQCSGWAQCIWESYDK
jgi:hypothetical protein